MKEGVKVYISKKDLLKETGISYGQLYRWKREALIPEEWFIKRSSTTGQETFFPKEQILQRVHDILKYKDTYSLEELAKVLSPEISNRLFEEDDLETFEEIDVDLIAGFMDASQKDCFHFLEIVVMCALSKLRSEFGLDEVDVMQLVKGIIPHLQKLDHDGYQLWYCELNGSRFLILKKEDSDVYLDVNVSVLKQISLSEVSKEMKVKYQNVFHFIVKEDVSNE